MPGKNEDFGYTISKGTVPGNGKRFTMIGGWTNSGIKMPQGQKTIPVCRESDGPYYKPDLLGAASDAFISKIYLDNCVILSTYEGTTPYLSLSISPVPSSTLINVESLPLFDTNPLIEVLDITGRPVQGWQLSSHTVDGLSIHIEGLLSACYFLKIQYDNNIAIGKFIKL